jgi:ABC-type transport system substrate-binding protein
MFKFNIIKSLTLGMALILGGALIAPTGLEAKNKFVFANSSPYDTMDPHALYDVGRVAYRINLYDGLLRWLDNPPKLSPWLADSYDISEDGTSYTFHLNKGATFHDGSPVEASDVVYSIERILALKKGAFSLYTGSVEPGSTKALDTHTVQFNLVQPSSIFLATVPAIHILNSTLVKSHEVDGDLGAKWLSQNDAGSGSFELDRYDPAIGFSAKRFEDHFMGWGDKYLDEIEFRTVIEINSRVLGLMNGDFHGTDGYLPQDQVKRLVASENVDVQVEESMRIFYVILNHNREIMQDINFRKALSHAFDYDSFITDILGGSVARNPAPMPNNIWGNPLDEKGYSYDMDKAREYLAKVKKPIPEFVLGALAGYGQTGQAAALFQNSLTKLGLKTRIVEEPWSVASKKMRDKEQMYDSLFIWRSTYYADPNNWIGEMYACDQVGARNNSWYCNPEVDKLLMDARIEPDQAKRSVNYKKAAKMVMDDAAGLFVYNTVWFGPYNKNVKGVRFSPIGNAQEMRWVYFEK